MVHSSQQVESSSVSNTERAMAAGSHLDVMHMMEHIACSGRWIVKDTKNTGDGLLRYGSPARQRVFTTLTMRGTETCKPSATIMTASNNMGPMVDRAG